MELENLNYKIENVIMNNIFFIFRESQLQVQSCYESNPSKPLVCRDKVLEFTNCVATMVTPGA